MNLLVMLLIGDQKGGYHLNNVYLGILAKRPGSIPGLDLIYRSVADASLSVIMGLGSP